MRDYGKVSPQFWTGDTGRKIRAMGRDAQVVALYVITAPSANMIGLYYLALPTLMHEVGIDREGACKALRSLFEGGFLHYDELEEVIYVPEMAKFQIGDSLDAKDNRVKGLLRDLESYRKSRFYNDFIQRYGEAYHLGKAKPLASPSEAPCKPLRSQEQEQEQDNKECGLYVDEKPNPTRAHKPNKDRDLQSPQGFTRFWDAWPSHDRKRDRQKCLAHWIKHLLEVKADQINAALEVWKKSREWTGDGGKYIPLPGTWLNNSRWESAPVNGQPVAAGSNGHAIREDR